MSRARLSGNRNKRSLALDLKSPDGLAVFRRLVSGCDVVVESFGTAILAEFGFPPAEIAELAAAGVAAS